MNVRPIDPRGLESETRAVYRVYFWSDQRRRSDEFELTDASDVNEVLAWIEAHAEGREVEAMLVVEQTAVYLIGPLDHAQPA